MWSFCNNDLFVKGTFWSFIHDRENLEVANIVTCLSDFLEFAKGNHENFGNIQKDLSKNQVYYFPKIFRIHEEWMVSWKIWYLLSKKWYSRKATSKWLELASSNFFDKNGKYHDFCRKVLSVRMKKLRRYRKIFRNVSKSSIRRYESHWRESRALSQFG